jgi:hypothetical protein
VGPADVRDMEEWLLDTNYVCQVLGLKHLPDHTTLQRTYKKLRNRDLSAGSSGSGEVIAADSTSFSPGQASLCYQPAAGSYIARGSKGPMRWALLNSARGPGSDAPLLSPLQQGNGMSEVGVSG